VRLGLSLSESAKVKWRTLHTRKSVVYATPTPPVHIPIETPYTVLRGEVRLTTYLNKVYDWSKRSVCRVQNSCFNEVHLIDLPKNAFRKLNTSKFRMFLDS
jgi:hypothetical protein